MLPLWPKLALAAIITASAAFAGALSHIQQPIAQLNAALTAPSAVINR